MLGIHAGGVDGGLGLLADQAALLSAHRGTDVQEKRLPFFNSREAALQSVE